VAIATGDIKTSETPCTTQVAYELGKEGALKAITINLAQIFGVVDKLGSIVKGEKPNCL